MGNYNGQAADLVNSMGVAIANWSTAMAVASVRWLIASLGQSSEPDLTAIAPVYNRMLAISLLIVGAVMALALIERIAWSSQGTGLSLIPRVVAACSDPAARPREPALGIQTHRRRTQGVGHHRLCDLCAESAS